MQWAMRAKSSLAILSIAIWWVLINLPWIAVGSAQFTGGQLIPVLNLLPAIAITALFISLYGKLRRVLLIAVVAILGLAVYLSLSTALESGAVVVAELERLSGILNPESHDAGVSIEESWWKLAAIATNAISMVITALGLRGSRTKPRPATEEMDPSDNRSLWDEQK